MRRIYALLGLASAQDIRDLKASTASAHERATALGEVAAAASVNWQQLQAKVDDLVAAQRKSMDDLVAEVREGAIDVADMAADVVAEARDNFDVSDIIDVDEVAQEIRDNIDLDDVAQEVKDNIDIDALVADAMGESEQLDKLVNNVLEREAPDIIGSHLKHIDWDDELSVHVELDGAIIASVSSNR
jgi:hypothetical protein